MKRWRTWARRLFWCGVLLWALALATQRYLLPPLVRSIAVKQLNAMGFKDAAITIGDVGLWQGGCKEVRLTEGVGASDLRLTYSPRSLLSGKVHEIRLGSLVVHATLDRNGVSIKGWPASIPRAGEKKENGWPCRQVKLQSGVVNLTDESGAVHVLFFSCDAGLNANTIALNLQCNAGGRLLNIRADISVEKEGFRMPEALVTLHPAPAPDVFVAWPQVHTAAMKVVEAQARYTPENGWRGNCQYAGIGFETKEWVYKGVTIPSLRGTVPLALSGDAGEIRVDIAEGPARITFADVRTELAGKTVNVAGDAINLNALDGKPFVHFKRWEGGRFRATVAAGATLAGGINAQWGSETTLAAREPTVRVTADLTDVGPENIAGELAVRGLRLSHSELEVSDVSASVPFSMLGPAYPDAGKIKVPIIAFRGKPLGTMDLNSSVSHTGIQVTGQWDVAESVKASLGASFDGKRGVATVDVPEGDLDRLLPTIQALVPMDGVSLQGRLAAQATIETRGGELLQSLRVVLKQAAYINPELETEIAGVNGTMEFDSLWPPHTRGNQRLGVQAYKQGKVMLSDGDLFFAVEDADRVNIERMNWRFGAEGRVTAHAIHFDRKNPAVDTELFVEDLNLEDWLTVLTSEKLTASGKLYGRIPFKARATPDGYKVAFGQGFLYNTPGIGSLQMKDATTVSDLLAQADPRFTQDPELRAVRERLSTALTDFEYSVFRFNLIPQPNGDTTLQMFTQGKGKGPRGQEIGGLTVNFNNFQLAANMALFGQSVFGEGVNRRLEEFFNPIEQKKQQGVQP